MVGAHQDLNGSRDLTTPLLGMICRPRARTRYNQISTHYEDAKRDTKCGKWGGLGSYGLPKVIENSAIR